MTLIKSISGIRGTIGGEVKDNFTPLQIVRFVSAFCQWIRTRKGNPNATLIIGKDGRISGTMTHHLVIGTVQAMGINSIDIGLTTTPTLARAVRKEKANGGIMISASHNPKEWNALKFFSDNGEFISPSFAREILQIATDNNFTYAPIHSLGRTENKAEKHKKNHMEGVKNYPLVQNEWIEKSNFSIVVDGINSSGAIYVPELLKTLGVKNIYGINMNITGDFAHNPEPLESHLSEIKKAVREKKADLGIVVDPDVDRLCFVCEDGTLFGEEYTLVAIADYILSHKKGAVVNNILSSYALYDIAEKHKVPCYSAAVGEVNVTQLMKEKKAVIGGEGSGGIIVPDFNYGRDALIGIGLFLSLLAERKISVSTLKNSYPLYHMVKDKIPLQSETDLIFTKTEKYFKHTFSNAVFNTTDGLKIILPKEQSWLCIRASNTEPILRIYAESISKSRADALVTMLKNKIQ